MEHPSCQHIEQYLQPGKHCHLVGIGGVSMRPLGLVLRRMGMEISGSDMNASVSTDELIAKGIQVSIGHRAENIEGADCLIRTAAAHNDNPEIAAARARGVPIFERAQAWGYIMRAYKNAICVSGTHGKTTTTSMLTHIFMQANRDPTIMIGGFLPLLGAGHRVGKGDTIILESCEYCNSFLNFFPTAAVILDVDADHLDFFKDLQDVERSFRKFASLVPADGLIVANGDDKNTRDTLAGMPYLSFGFDAKNDVYGKNFSEDFSEFDVFCGGQPYAHLHLGVIGRHNALNALAACAVAWKFGISGETAAAALAEFHGALMIEASGNAQVHVRRVVICVVDVVQQLIGDERYALRGACNVVAHRIVLEHIAVQLHADAPGGAVEVHRYLLRDYAALLLDVLRGEIGVLNEIQQYLKVIFEVRGTAEVVTRAVVGSSGVAGSAGLGKPCEGFLFR